MPELDLGRQTLGVSLEDAREQQIRYYRSRARQHVSSDYSGSGELIDRFDEFQLGADVLEFAAGTGFWTRQIVERGATVTAIDAAPEALEVNRGQPGSHQASVRYIVADLLSWEPRRRWDSCVGFFWLCKIPDQRLRSFLDIAMAALRDGGSFFFGDKILHTSEARTTEFETRTLNDGQEFAVVDRPRSADEFRAAFAELGADVEVVGAGRFCAVIGTKRIAGKL